MKPSMQEHLIVIFNFYLFFLSGVRSGHPSAEHIVLVRNRGEQAQDGAAAVSDLPRNLSQGYDMQLSLHRKTRTEDTARVSRLRSIFRRSSVSNIDSDSRYSIHYLSTIFRSDNEQYELPTQIDFNKEFNLI